MQKQLDAEKVRREAEADKDDEFQDAVEGDDDPEKSKEEWQNELDDLKAAVADDRKKVKIAKSKAQKANLERSIEVGTARVAGAARLYSLGPESTGAAAKEGCEERTSQA